MKTDSITMVMGSPKSHNRKRKSSFWMHDPEVIFKELDLKKGTAFLDVGCGSGDYSIRAAEEVGESGFVYATDMENELIDDLVRNTEQAGLKNIKAIVNDVHEKFPFEDNTIDSCLISTVLHSLDFENAGKIIFPEIRRVLKPEGRLIIIECKKEDLSFGPPLNMRISPSEMENHVSTFDFEKIDLVDLGFNYMIKFLSK
ncbi:class I SAM-dependent methyltransferase [Methanococcoides sp. SA1]|nr:class I SAM-dependent methyltransferase [Methanococcoides sp. SA1]